MSKRKKKKPELPPCGLYRTGRALAESPHEVPAGILVMFHNHSNRGIPMLQLPLENEHNVWEFHQYGPGIEDDDDFLEAMEPLREEGLYFLRRPLETPDGEYPANTLIQLGYNLDADPIIFIAHSTSHDNGVHFLDTGYRFESLEIFDWLSPSTPLNIPGDYSDENEDFEDDLDSSELLN